jgi:hypothetical protein
MTARAAKEFPLLRVMSYELEVVLSICPTTELTQRRAQAPFCLPFDKLRTNGSMVLSILSVSRFLRSQSAKNGIQKED